MMLPMFYYKYFLKNFICTFKALTCIKGVPWSFQYTLYWFFRLLKPHINFRKHFCTYRWLEFLCLRLRWKHIRKGSSNGRYEQEAWLKQTKTGSVFMWAPYCCLKTELERKQFVYLVLWLGTLSWLNCVIGCTFLVPLSMKTTSIMDFMDIQSVLQFVHHAFDCTHKHA